MTRVLHVIEQRGPLLWIGVVFALLGMAVMLPTVWGGAWIWLFGGGVITVVGFAVVRSSTRPIQLAIVGEELVVRVRGRPAERSIARASVGGVEIRMGGALDSALTGQKYVVKTAPPLENSRGPTIQLHGFGQRSEAIACAHAIGKALGVPVLTRERR